MDDRRDRQELTEPGSGPGAQHLAELEVDVRALRQHLLDAEAGRRADIEATHPTQRRSATNLVHYVELRRHDVRDVQARLSEVGLSSLGRSEANVLASIEAVLAVLVRLRGGEAAAPVADVGITEGAELLKAHADGLLGPTVGDRSSRIMVTLPTEAADDPASVREMVAAGMDLARVNCAHDTAEEWARMVAAVRDAPRPDGSPCLVAMDLAGPKLRTGPLRPGPRVVKVKPRRDVGGHVTRPAKALLTAIPSTVGGEAGAGARAEGGERADEDVVVVPVDDEAWIGRRRAGDEVRLRDHRGSRRTWTVVDTSQAGCLVAAEKTAYVATGTELSVGRGGDADRATVGELPQTEQAHRVGLGDRIVLTRSLEPAEPTPMGQVHRIGCTLPEVFEHARPGHRVWFDDGKLGGKIESVGPDEIVVAITEGRARGANLKAEKGINLPDTDLPLGALTAKDLEDLDFVAAHADMVNLSFVRRPEDVRDLQQELTARGAGEMGIVLKIEDVDAFSRLPDLLLMAMRYPGVGVMIARGDLAVEVGFERLAEVQEEITWICEAAHVPVIWATEVLDNLARTGQFSRAEVTDAAMAQRAECVMLNKGPHITQAIEALHSILGRMRHHQHKKRSLLRRLRAWDGPAATS